jgi:tripartite-type tricarboxylate transporter receptor subunit TctC
MTRNEARRDRIEPRRRTAIRRGTGIAVGLAAVAGVGPLAAQEYPQRPIRVIVPFTAGGIVDILARELGARLGPRLGQPFVVENRTGASGSIGTEAVARAAPDGHTLLLASGVITINAAMRKDLPWHPVDSFAPVSMLATSPQVIVVNPKVPARTLQELVAYARANPGRLDFGSVGNGSTPHLTIELLKSLTGTSMVHIPYRGQPEVLVDLAQGNIALTSVTLSLAEPMIRSGQLRPLAVTTPRRAAALPDVPTVAEAGIPSFDVPNWFGVMAPRGTPEPVIRRLHAEIARIGSESEFAIRLAQLGADPSILGPAEFERFVRDDLKRWTDVVRRAGLTAQ